MSFAPSTITQAWTAFYASAPLDAPVTEGDYLKLKELADHLLDNHNIEEGAYAPLFDIVTRYMHEWELEHEPELKNPDVPPHRMLAFLMEQQGVTQYQLQKEGVVNQGTLSKILKGERGISKALAKRLAEKFGVSVEVFL